MSEIDPKLKKKIGQIAKDAEEKVEDVTNLFFAIRDVISKMFPKLSEVKLNNRAYNALEEHYNAEKYKKAKQQWFIPFGVFSEAQDQNEELRDEILKDFANPAKRIKMIEEGKIMVMKVSDKPIDNENTFYSDVYKPIKAGKKYKTTEVNKELVVIEGDLWEPGDKPVPRDYRRQIKYGDEMYDNYSYSKPLDPAWKLQLFGIGFYVGTKEVKRQTPDGIEVIKVERNLLDDGVICKVTWTGDHADPSSPKFICKKPIWFNPCKVKSTDTNFTTPLLLSTRTRTDIEIVPMDNFDILEIVRKINARVKNNANQIKAVVESPKFETLPEQKQKKIKTLFSLHEKFVELEYIPIIDLADIDEYHLTHRALYEDGKIKKDEKGQWDETDFNSFALCECSFTGIFEKDNKPPKMIITDASLPEKTSLFPKFSNGIDKQIPPSSVLVSLTTSRGNQAYDEDTKKFIVNPDKAKAIPKVKGIKVLLDFSKINIAQLKADL